MLFNTELPIEEVIPDIRRVLENGRNAVLEAPPGAGKTTIVPLALLDEAWLSGRRIIVLEPRRLAAKAAAARMSALIGEEVGSTVGFRTRLESRVGPSTRIEVVTEGILTRFLQNDPSLKGIGLLIFDEFHERSVHADLGLALSLESQSVLRDDLRILVMSATLDGEEVSALLGNAPVIKSMGRAYPVSVRYRGDAVRQSRTEGMTGPGFISGVVDSVLSALREEPGSILVFLPGSGEIKRVETALRGKNLPLDTDVVPLYGDLPREMQDLAIKPSPEGKRKVVLATSIAETSLTIDGIRVVIDGGLKRVPRFSPSIGMSRLETVRVTRASSIQRSGRAGRLEPGVSIRLWSEGEDKTLRDKNTPEILEADLTPLALELAVWGIKDPEELRWIDPPPDTGIAHAREILTLLEAIDSNRRATDHGRLIAKLPLHPRLAHMAVKGKGLGQGNMACLISALLTERDIFKPGPGNRDSDIRHRLECLLRQSPRTSAFEVDRALCERIRSVAKQLKKLLDIKDSGDDIEKAGLLLAFAYPDRIGKRRFAGEPRYLLANGRGAYFQGPEFTAAEYIVAASVDGGDKESRVFLAAPLLITEIEEHFADEIVESVEVAWDQGEKGVSAKKKRSLWNLVLSENRLPNPGKEALLKAFLSGIRQNGLSALPWDRASENLRERINLLSRVKESTRVSFPELTDERLLQGLEEWLGPWCDGMTRLEHLKKLDMKTIIMGLLTWEQQQSLERLAPTHITVPSGSRIPIDYASGGRPVLAVRLQEMFGFALTPSIANGSIKLLLHLLSPAGRPVQVTEDLAGFWASSYALVKKEMKGRYPKHYWPDNPMEALPSRGVKRKRPGK